MADRTVSVALRLDAGQYVSGATKAATATKGIGDTAESTSKRARSSFDLAGKATLLWGVAAAGAGLAFKDVISAASNAEQSIGGVQAVFKDYAQSVIANAEEADRALGLSANSYRELATVIGSQMKNAGIPMDELAERTEVVIQTGADLAAQFGGSTEEAVRALSSAFRGEMDPIERYGISLTAASVGAKAVELGLAESSSELSQNAKLMASLALITEQSADAQGAFARESETAAGRAQRAAAQWENLKVTLGNELLPLWSGLVDVLGTRVIPALGDIIGAGADLVRFFMDLPGPVKVAVAAFAGVAALKGPVGAAFETIAVRAMYARDSLGKASLSMAGVKRAGAGLVGAFGGPWGLAIAGAVTGLSLLASTNNDAAEAEAAHKARVGDLTDALRESNGEITENIRLSRIKEAQDEGLIDIAIRAGAAERDIGAALNGNEPALRRVLEVMRAYSASQIDVNASGYNTVDVLNEEGVAARDAAAKLAVMAGEVDGARAALEQQEAVLSETIGPTRLLGEASKYAAGLTSDFGTAVEDTSAAADRLRDSLERLRGGTVSAMEAEANYYDVIRDTEDALEDMAGAVTTSNGKLNLQTEAGAAAFRQLVNLGDASNDVITSMKTQGATAEQLSRRDQELRISFIKTAQQMGIGREEARKLADQILGVPASRTTTLNVKSEAANKAVNFTQNLIDSMRGKTVTVTVKTARDLASWAAQNGIQTVGGYAEGGWTGPGGKYDVAGVVHADEYVLTKEQVRRLGIDRIEAFANGGLPGYATGGIVVNIDNSRLPGEIAGAIGATMRMNAGKAGVAGGGSVPGSYQAMFAMVRQAFPQARLNSGYRPGDPGYHGRGKAVDLGQMGRSGGMGHSYLAAMNRWIHDRFGRNSAELIYTGLGDDRPDLKNGRPLNYGPGTNAAHRNHVHWATYDQGGWLQPGFTVAYNGTGRPERVVSPSREVSGRSMGSMSSSSTVDSRSYPVIVQTQATDPRAVADYAAARQREREILSA